MGSLARTRGAGHVAELSIKEFQKRHAYYLAEALEQPLLPKDMAALQTMRQLDLFLSLKRDLALVSSLPC